MPLLNPVLGPTLGIPEYAGYFSDGSKSLRPGKVSAVFIFAPFVGITITVSPSKSAPENFSATLVFIPIALQAGPIIACASLLLLFTLSLGDSNGPA